MRKMHHAASVEKMLAALAPMDVFLLRKQFRLLYGNEAPSSFSRQLLTHAVAYQLQVQIYGGVSASTCKQLAKIVVEGMAVKQPATQKLCVSTRLVREWHGVMHEVQILENGVLWNGIEHRSLSQVARAITNTHCSGPRFFGLHRKTGVAA